MAEPSFSEAERREARKAARLARAAASRRRRRWAAAAAGAEAAGLPLSALISVTWGACAVGDLRDGHVLGLRPVARERRLWAALRLCAARAGVPWVAARAPEHDGRRGLHLHLALHLPDDGLRDAVQVVGRLTGAPAEWFDVRGRSVRGAGRWHHGVVARSACGGWMIGRAVRDRRGDGRAVVSYLSKGDGEDAVDGQHRLSHHLAALGRDWEARHAA